MVLLVAVTFAQLGRRLMLLWSYEEGEEFMLAAAISFGGDIAIPPGTYAITERTTITLSRNTRIRCDPAAVFVLDANIGAQAFTIDGGESYSFDVDGGVFDASAVSNPGVGGDIGTIWDLNKLTRWSVTNGIYRAGATFEAQKGDTAVDVIACGPGRVSGCVFTGWADNALYLSGGNKPPPTEDDGGPTFISGNSFVLNSTGVAIKRKNRNVIITGNHFQRNHVAIGCYEVGSGFPHPGDRITISDNRIEDNIAASIELRGGHGEAVITGNTILDWGYTLSGAVVSSPDAIELKGSRHCLISNNVMAMRERGKTPAHVGIVIDNYTVDGTLYIATGNYGTGNVFRNVEYSIYEAPSVGPNKFLLCDCSDNVPSHFILSNANSEWSGHYTLSNFRWYRASTLLQNF